MNRQVTEICMIVPSEKMGMKAKEVIAEYNHNVNVYIAALDNIVLMCNQLAELGAKVIICRQGTKAYIEENVKITTVGIDLTTADYIDVMKQIKEITGLVAFINHDRSMDNMESLCKLMGINAKQYIFRSIRECEECVNQAIADGAIFGIGGIVAENFAAEKDFKYTVLESSKEAILQAITTAKQIVKVQNEEIKKQENYSLQIKRYEAVLNFTHDGIIAIDENGSIDIINPVAEKILKVKKEKCIGEDIHRVFPNTQMLQSLENGEKQINQIMNISGTTILTNRIPIIIDDKVKGVVATFQDVKTIQESEKSIRRKSVNKGYLAKYTFNDIKGNSETIHKTIKIAKSYAKISSTILIHGETGTGKELFAQSIHNSSLRKNGPFVAINCSAMTKSLLESEFFGYEEGTFTGASKGGKAGLFEIAHGGTIFLDEIGDISPETQVHLLRVLQEKEIRRVGSNKIIPVDVRVITATNKNLEEEVEKGNFREDLFYRLNILKLYLPPLRDRRNDTKEIAKNFLMELDNKNYRQYESVLMKILNELEHYLWPGNIRELQNLVERIHVLAVNKETKLIDTGLLVSKIDKERFEEKKLGNLEYNRIIRALEENNLSKAKTAESLGMSRSTLWRKLKAYNIEI
ncbi:sigma-54-dependent Fis family transcriptional regulator [Geosporobacter ferrireducens]|nr:sigma-54-dependent Fis family transcriptional regulator [Geosporobacter ferrireducens]MTI54690.1 PAS domain-containing protein [Geosporobacter ferrireducens]